MKNIILRALSQVVPNSRGVEAPSRLEQPVEISADAMASYAETGKAGLVSLDPDGISNPEQITTYTLPSAINTENGGADIWPGRYIAEGESKSSKQGDMGGWSW